MWFFFFTVWLFLWSISVTQLILYSAVALYHIKKALISCLQTTEIWKFFVSMIKENLLSTIMMKNHSQAHKYVLRHTYRQIRAHTNKPYINVWVIKSSKVKKLKPDLSNTKILNYINSVISEAESRFLCLFWKVDLVAFGEENFQLSSLHRQLLPSRNSAGGRGECSFNSFTMKESSNCIATP